MVDGSGMGTCWTARRTLERSTHPERRALGAGELTSECLRIRMTRADGVRSSRVAHGAMGTQGSNWRVGNPHGGQTRRAGALDRLVNGLGGGQGHVRQEAPGAGSRAHADLAWRTKVGRREYSYQLAW